MSMTTCTCTRGGQKRRPGGRAVTPSRAEPSRGYLVLRVGVHRPDFQEVEGDLHLRAATQLAQLGFTRHGREEIYIETARLINKRWLVEAGAEDKSGDE